MKQQHPLQHPLPGTVRLKQPHEARLWKYIKHHQPHVGKPLESLAFPVNRSIKMSGSPKLEASPKGQLTKSCGCVFSSLQEVSF